MDKPRLALYLPNLDGGGAERMMVNLACGFAARGYAVDLVLATAQGPFLSEVCSAVQVVDLGAKGVVSSLPSLIRYLRRAKPKALLVTLSHASVVALIARRLAFVQTRVVVREANMLRIYDRDKPAVPQTPSTLSVRTRFRVRVLRWSIRNIYPWADAFIGVSHGVAENIERFIGAPAEKVHTIYNPVVNDSLLEGAGLEPDHPWFALGQPPVVLGAGRLEGQKDFATLIRAFALVRQERPAKLVILGEGKHRARLEALVTELGLEGEVSLPGFVSNPFAFMARADTFVLSSLHEGLPGVLIQAMACGCKDVSTDCPSGPREILQDGRLGSLTPVADVSALAKAITETLEQNPETQRQERGERAADFSDTKVVPEYLKVLLPG